MNDAPPAQRRDGWFPATRWSLVLTAQDDGPEAGRAMESLCRLYWKPIYTFVRAHGFAPPDAEDLTQDFFARLLQSNLLHGTAPEKGKLRTFLAVTLRNFLSNARERASAQKRGGHAVHVGTDISESEALLLAAPDATPDKLFDRQWALTLLGRVLDRLGAEYRRAGKGDLFDALRETLLLEGPVAKSQDMAARLGISDGAVRVAAHRLRQRYRDLLVEETAQTLGTATSVEEELRALLEMV